MVDTVAIQIPQPRVREASAFNATVYFRDAGAASTPTNVYYRIDNLTAGTVLANWTSVTAATSVTIAVTATHNALTDQCNTFERLQLTVDANHGLATQVREVGIWDVVNVAGF
jgi:hypothetical protein